MKLQLSFFFIIKFHHLFFFKFEYPLKVLFVQYVLILVDFIIDDEVVFSILSIVFGLHVFLSNGYLSYEFCRCIS